jgi:hypothetical protein
MMRHKCDVQIQEVSEFVEGCTISSSKTECQMIASKIQEGKDSVDRVFTLAIAAYPEFLDLEPGSSEFGREAERHRPSEENTSAGHYGSHLGHHQCFIAIHEDESDSDSDSDDEELVDKHRKQ